MSSLRRSVGREGVNSPADVKLVQELLNKQVSSLRLAPLKVDGRAGPKTIGAIEAFQRHIGFMQTDGRVDPNGRTIQALEGNKSDIPPAPIDPNAGRTAAWPPKPSFSPLVDNEARARVFGKFEYVHEPTPQNKENIRILGNWVARNIVIIPIDFGPHVGVRKVQFHRLAADQLKALFVAWQQAGLLDRILTFAGAFVPRFVRGSTKYLSNHSFGSAFDINVAWNGLNRQPALVGEKGSVRELVPIANQLGFYWGGHFGRLDGMHFEVAKILK